MRGLGLLMQRGTFVSLIVTAVVTVSLAGCLDSSDGADSGRDPRFGGPERPVFTQGRAVIAIIDTGINPYHETFRSARTERALDLLPGYPEQSLVLPLSLDAEDLDAAHAADQGLWEEVRAETLYDVPGTSIAGMIAFGSGERAAAAPASRPGLDESGHGTAAAGMVAASCPDCLLVAVEVGGAAEGRRALDWLRDQAWVDVVVYPARAGAAFAGAGLHNQDVVDASEFAWARANAEAGQVVVVASGNGGPSVGGVSTATYTPLRDLSYGYWTAGPDWVVTVGAAAADRAEATTWHTFPVDIIAPGVACETAHPFSMSDTLAFEGTSCSAPTVGGQIGEVLRATRDELRDGATGPRSGQRLVVPETIDAPAVTREDLVRAYLLTAAPLDATTLPMTLTDPLAPETWTTGDGALSPLYAGWGLHDATSLPAAVAVLTGATDAPAPGLEEAEWFPVDQRLRRTLWGSWDAGESRIPFPSTYGGPVKVPQDTTGLEALYVSAVASR